jgi:hypothetical protein
MEHIGERVPVVVSFTGNYGFKPLKFKWLERVIPIKEITYSWVDMRGKSKLYHFSVTDGKTLYELSFNTTSLIWKLEKIETDI